MIQLSITIKQFLDYFIFFLDTSSISRNTHPTIWIITIGDLNKSFQLVSRYGFWFLVAVGISTYLTDFSEIPPFRS